MVGVPDGVVAVGQCGGCQHRGGRSSMPWRCWLGVEAVSIVVAVPRCRGGVGQVWSLNAASSSRWRVGGTIVLQLAWRWFLMAWWVLVMRGGCQHRGGRSSMPWRCWSGVAAVGQAWWPFLDAVVGVGHAWSLNAASSSRWRVGGTIVLQLAWRCWSGVEAVSSVAGVGQVWSLNAASSSRWCVGGTIVLQLAWWPFLDAVAGVGRGWVNLKLSHCVISVLKIC